MLRLKNTLFMLMLGLMLTSTASLSLGADTTYTPNTDEFSMPGEHLDPEIASLVETLDDQEMAATRGELWPLVGAIGAVVSVDLALQAYFWGVYVPAMSPTVHYTQATPVFR